MVQKPYKWLLGIGILWRWTSLTLVMWFLCRWIAWDERRYARPRCLPFVYIVQLNCVTYLVIFKKNQRRLRPQHFLEGDGDCYYEDGIYSQTLRVLTRNFKFLWRILAQYYVFFQKKLLICYGSQFLSKCYGFSHIKIFLIFLTSTSSIDLYFYINII